ncbi:MAG: homoserine kinase [Thermoanaerobaculia bacterium]
MHRSSSHRTEATAFAPASVGNVAVGFDILGHSLAGPGDRVTVRVIDQPEVRIATIRGSAMALPMNAEGNTAGMALMAMRKELGLTFGFEVEIDKGIALSSGMGGSAASAVAALVAANALLETPLTAQGLYEFALSGEAVASGGRHGDNVAPMLIGGLALATADSIVSIPVPDEWHCVLIHPEMTLETRHAREVLQGPYALHEFVAQSSHLALVLAGCFRGNPELVRKGLQDVLVEPRRSSLIPGLQAVRRSALDRGAMGSSISGAGPSVFAWFESRAQAEASGPAMQAAFAQAGLPSECFLSPVNGPAARLVQ